MWITERGERQCGVEYRYMRRGSETPILVFICFPIIAFILIGAAFWRGTTDSGKIHAIVPVVVVATSSAPADIMPIVPGMTNPDINSSNMSQNICNPHWSTSSIRPSTSYTGPIKVQALAAYNARFGTTYKLADGELDHLISIELGGNPTSVENLWFEPYVTTVSGKVIGAHQKDLVENYLHKQVCSGAMSLDVAQDLIVNSWYQVYLDMQSTNAGALIDDSDPDDALP